MKKSSQIIIIAIVTVLILALVLPAFASAKDLSSLKVGFSPDINASCYQPSGYDPVRGCYIADENRIVIRLDLPEQLLPYVFLRLLGHYVIYGVSDDILQGIFRPAPDKARMTSIRELAADEFSIWILGGSVSREQDRFFKEQLAK